MKVAPSLGSRNPGAVPANPDALDNVVKYSPGCEDRIFPVLPPEEERFGVRIADAISVHVDAGFGPEPEADRIAVYPDNTGQCAAKGIKR